MIEREISQDGSITWEYDHEKGVLTTTFPNGSTTMDALNTERLALFLSEHKAAIARKRIGEALPHQSYLKSGLHDSVTLDGRVRFIYDEEDGTLAWMPFLHEATFIQPPDVRRLAAFLEANKESLIAHSKRMRTRYDVSEKELPAIHETTVIYQEARETSV